MKRPKTHRQIFEAALRGLAPYKTPRIAVNPNKAYLAKGGPFDGQVLSLQDGNSAWFSVQTEKGCWHGRYLVGLASKRKADPTVQKTVQSLRASAKGCSDKEQYVLDRIPIGTTVWQSK